MNQNSTGLGEQLNGSCGEKFPCNQNINRSFSSYCKSTYISLVLTSLLGRMILILRVKRTLNAIRTNNVELISVNQMTVRSRY